MPVFTPNKTCIQSKECGPIYTLEEPYIHTRCIYTRHIHISLTRAQLIQEEQIAALQAQLRLARKSIEEKEAAAVRDGKEMEDKVHKLEEQLMCARDTATDKKAAQKLRKLLGQQENAIELLCTHVEAHQIMASLTEAGLSQGETTPGAAIAAASRHSLEIMSTLTEDGEEGVDEVAGGTPGRQRDSSMAGKNLMLLVKLQKDLEKERVENEELRQTADCCFVREQESKRRCEELESDNKQMEMFTEQMASTHSRLSQGVIDLQAKQATMVLQETHEEALAEIEQLNAEIEQLKADQLHMVPQLEKLVEQIETLESAAAASSGGEEEQKQKVAKLEEEMEDLREAAAEHAAAAQTASATLEKLQEQTALAATTTAHSEFIEEQLRLGESAQGECKELRARLAEQVCLYVCTNVCVYIYKHAHTH